MTKHQQWEHGLIVHALGRTTLLVLDLIPVFLHVAFRRPMGRRRGVPKTAQFGEHGGRAKDADAYRARYASKPRITLRRLHARPWKPCLATPFLLSSWGVPVTTPERGWVI